jgi:hypothetical protein
MARKLFCVFSAALIVLAVRGDRVAGQVVAPIVGKSEKSDTSPPLRELAEAQKKAPENAEQDKDKGHQAVVEFLRKQHPGALPSGKITALEKSAAVTAALPNSSLYVLRFQQWPVNVAPPNGLQPGNICVVTGKDVSVVSDAKQLGKLFAARLPKATTEAQRRDAVVAWLRVSQEMHQDGFFNFKTIDKKAIAVTDEQATGQVDAEAKGGNQGRIGVTLTFNADGTLTEATEKVELKPGVRPICQATKLLDADPIVRRMAERDILVMGSLARDYLLDQRAKANDALRAAIDRVWDQVRREGR